MYFISIDSQYIKYTLRENYVFCARTKKRNMKTPTLQATCCLLCIFSSVFFTGCDETEKIPNVYEVTSTFHRKTIPEAGTETQVLQLTTPGEFAARTEKVSMNVSDINVTAVKTEGNRIPPFTAFVSQTFFRHPGDLLSGFSTVAGNAEWLKNRTGEIAICTESLWLEHGSESFGYQNTDSTINLAQAFNQGSPLQPVYREAGASYMAAFTDQTLYIPWAHPEVPGDRMIDIDDVNSELMHFDLRSLTRLLFGVFSDATATAVSEMSSFPLSLPGGINIPLVQVSLGGSNNDGDFKLHYLPQLQYNGAGSAAGEENQVINRPGVGFYFEGTINLRDGVFGAVPVGAIRVIIPAFLVFESTVWGTIHGSDAGNLGVVLQPIAELSQNMGTSSFGMDKIVVLTSTPLGVQAGTVANEVRGGIQSALVDMATEGEALELYLTSTVAFSTGVNKYRKNPAKQPEYDVFLVPTNCGLQHDNPMCFQYNGIITTQVQPETPESTQVACFVLGR